MAVEPEYSNSHFSLSLGDEREQNADVTEKRMAAGLNPLLSAFSVTSKGINYEGHKEHEENPLPSSNQMSKLPG